MSKRRTMLIPIKDGVKEEVEIADRRKGLAITPYLAKSNVLKDAYTITHEASGFAVVMGPMCLSEARALLRRIAPLADWRRDAEYFYNRPRLSKRVRQAVRAAL